MGSTDPGHGPAGGAGARLTGSVSPPVDALPRWATLRRAPNPGPMTLSGTNSWLLAAPGAGRTVVVDPGPDDESHLAALAVGPVELILITHGHPDHVEGLSRLRASTGAPVRAVDPRYGEPLADGEVLRAAGLRIEALRTPGHTADSACFLVPDADEPAVLTGDTVLGAGSTVVMWPDGDLGDYLSSLARLAALPSGGTPAARPVTAGGAEPDGARRPLPVLPGHGPALADCAAACAGYQAHRRERLAQVRRALAAGAAGTDAVLEVVYPGIEESLRFAAERTVRAQLAYLRAEDHGESSDRPLRLDRS